MAIISAVPVIATWIVLDSEQEASFYPQTGIKSSANPRVHDLYWRCVECFFASAFRVSVNAYDFVLFSNVTVIPSSVAPLLQEYGVRLVTVPREYLPPPGYFGMWRNQFYILDILKNLAGLPQPPASLILDSDCLFLSDPHSLFGKVQESGVLTYQLSHSPREDINGLTRLQMQGLFSQLLGKVVRDIPEYFGGEIFAATGAEIQRLYSEVTPVWEDSMRRASRGELKLNEEAHFLSYLYYKNSYEKGTANQFIRRIWTQRKFRNACPEDLDLTIWHLPAEKSFGYRDLFRLVEDGASWFWTLPPSMEWRTRIASIMGIPEPGNIKRTKDVLRSAIRKLR